MNENDDKQHSQQEGHGGSSPDDNAASPPEEQRPAGCGQCDKPANVHYTFVAGNKQVKVAMCADCPKNRELQKQGAHGILEELAPKLMHTMESAIERGIAKCPVCGFTLKDLERTRRLGCSGCYDTFQATILRLISSVQRGHRHLGKISSRHDSPEIIQNRLSLLKDRLNTAVKEEEFENAANLRDEIKRLQKAARKAVN